METTRCLGCGATIFAKPGACPRCGFATVTTTTQRIAFGVALFAIGALMFYGIWSLIPQVMASL